MVIKKGNMYLCQQKSLPFANATILLTDFHIAILVAQMQKNFAVTQELRLYFHYLYREYNFAASHGTLCIDSGDKSPDKIEKVHDKSDMPI